MRGFLPELRKARRSSSKPQKRPAPTASQRDYARRVYDEAIRQVASAGPLGGRDVGKIWDQVRPRWQSISQKALAALMELAGRRKTTLRAERQPQRRWPIIFQKSLLPISREAAFALRVTEACMRL